MKLQDYNFTMKHIPGKTNTKADILSCLDWYEEHIEEEEITMLKDEFMINRMEEEETTSEMIMLQDDMFEEEADIRSMKVAEIVEFRDEEFEKQVRNDHHREDTIRQGLKKKDGWMVEKEGIVYVGGKIYIPPNIKLRERILVENHNSTTAGHPGIYKTDEMIRRNTWWPGLLKDVKKFIKGCEECQKNKIIRESKHAPLHPHAIPNHPWETISVDLIGPLPTSNGYDAILVIVDKFTKMIKVIPTNTTITSEQMAQQYRDHVWRNHGLPKKIISDRGPQFASKFMKDLCKSLGINQNLSTAYHPQTDGQMERINQDVEQYLRIFTNFEQTDWADWLPMVEFQYNDKEHSATKQSPFMLN